MIKGFDLLNEVKGSSVLVNKFEDIVKNADIIYFNENHIEIPGIVVFALEKKGFAFQVMNPGLDIFIVSKEDFDRMISLLKVEEQGVVFFETKSNPISTVRVNVLKIKSKLILARVSEDTLILNKDLFTTNEFEYQGSGMFSGRKNVFFISKEMFKTIKDIIID